MSDITSPQCIQMHKEWTKNELNSVSLSYYHGYNKEYSKKYRENRSEDQLNKVRKYKREYIKMRRQIPFFKLYDSISKQICQSLHGKKNGRKWESIVGYTIDDLMVHLEKQFEDGMTWNNYGKYWHVDHCIPLSWLYNDFKKAWALTNLQPLEAKKNLSKGNRYATIVTF